MEMRYNIIVSVTVVVLSLLSDISNGEMKKGNISHVGQQVRLNVKTRTAIAETDDHFICATLDWWPSDKCDYGQCPWGKAGILNLDLDNKILGNAIKAFKPLRIRIGGSLQDQVIYDMFGGEECEGFEKKKEGTLFGFTGGCLKSERWDKLGKLFKETGALITFGLNAMRGREKYDEDPNNNLWIGSWNSTNAFNFILYTQVQGYNVDAWEFGNELCGSGVGARVDPTQYANDTIELRRMITEIYDSTNFVPKLLAPAGFYDKQWFNTFLQASGPGIVDGITHHIYDLGSGDDPELIHKIQDPFYLSRTAETFQDVMTSVNTFGPWSAAWVGEAGGAYNSGGKQVSHTFVDGFWYVDQLGTTSTFNHKVYCRQSFIGGNYALLNTTSFIPNPDYYSALLWHRLMGTKVLAVTHDNSPYLRTYAHCSKSTSGIAVVLINMSNSTTFNVSVVDDMNLYWGRKVLIGGSEDSSDNHDRQEYHLTPKDGNIQSDELLLNGTPVKLTKSLDIPPLNPKLVDPTHPITVAPDSIVFATLKGFKAPACQS